jgi:hypothetical protein
VSPEARSLTLCLPLVEGPCLAGPSSAVMLLLLFAGSCCTSAATDVGLALAAVRPERLHVVDHKPCCMQVTLCPVLG